MFLLIRCLLVTLDCFQWPVWRVLSSRSSGLDLRGMRMSEEQEVDDSMKSDMVSVIRKGEYSTVD